jgi:hypothetical protein
MLLYRGHLAYISACCGENRACRPPPDTRSASNPNGLSRRGGRRRPGRTSGRSRPRRAGRRGRGRRASRRAPPGAPSQILGRTSTATHRPRSHRGPSFRSTTGHREPWLVGMRKSAAGPQAAGCLGRGRHLADRQVARDPAKAAVGRDLQPLGVAVFQAGADALDDVFRRL